MSNGDDALGPIGYLIVEFPGSKMTGEALPELLALVDAGIVRILDFVFITRGTDGSVEVIEVTDIDGDGELDLVVFEGVRSGLIGESDIAEAGNVIEPGSSAGVLIYENRWAGRFMQGIRNGGGQVVAAGYIPIADILESLDAVEG